MLTVLRPRAYLGEVYFRGTWYRAEHHHPPLVAPDVFEHAQQIMIARGDDRSRRAASSSDYLLAGRVFCDRCGKRYLGAAAHSRTARYRYYTCFSANRYGKHACDADRLPADKLEHLVLDALINTCYPPLKMRTRTTLAVSMGIRAFRRWGCSVRARVVVVVVILSR